MQRSLQPSLPIGAARSLSQAADADLAETKTSRLPSVALTGTGYQLPAPASISAVLARLPDLAETRRDILLAPDAAQAGAQDKAQRSYAESMLPWQKPSVDLLASGSSVAGAALSTDWTGGVSATIRLIQPGAAPTLMAAHRRAQAALPYRDEAIEAERHRLLEMHEVATSTLARASTLQRCQYLDRRSLFDVMDAEGDHHTNRVAHANALFDAQQVVALMWSMGRGVAVALQ